MTESGQPESGWPHRHTPAPASGRLNRSWRSFTVPSGRRLGGCEFQPALLVLLGFLVHFLAALLKLIIWLLHARSLPATGPGREQRIPHSDRLRPLDVPMTMSCRGPRSCPTPSARLILGAKNCYLFFFMSKPACPMCEMTEVLEHAERYECVTCGHE